MLNLQEFLKFIKVRNKLCKFDTEAERWKIKFKFSLRQSVSTMKIKRNFESKSEI